jgi:hypothetical protein
LDNGATWVEVGTIFTSGGTLDDGPLLPGSVVYQVATCNGLGCSAWSPSSTPVVVGSPLTLEFIAPEEGKTLHGWEQIAIRVTGNLSVKSAHIFYKGNELVGVQRSKADAKVWFVNFDTDADPRQGEGEFSAYVIDANDCPSPTVTITRVLNNTLLTDLAFIEIIIEHDDPIAAVQAYARLAAPGGLRDYYYEWAVYNPPPQSSPMAANPTDEQIATYEAEWPLGQKILLDADEGLLQALNGEGEPVELTGTCVLRGRRTRTQRVVKYDTVNPVTKFRAGNDGGAESEMLAFALPRIYSLTKEGGWVTKHDLSAPAFDLAGATDAALRKDKIIAAFGSSFMFLDIPTDNADLDFGNLPAPFKPRTETKAALFCEYLPDGDVVALLFGDNVNTSLYVIRADQSKAVVSFAGQTTHVHATGKYLALAVGSSIRLFESGEDAAPVVLTHTAAISFVRVETNGDVVFGDADGSTYRLPLGDEDSVLLDDQTFPTRAWAPYAMTTEEVTEDALGALGGDSRYLYQEVIVGGVQALYAQSRDFGADTTITAMERYAENIGDTVFESLLVAVSDAAGDYVARIARAPKPLKSYEGSDASDVVFAATLFA